MIFYNSVNEFFHLNENKKIKQVIKKNLLKTNGLNFLE